MMINNKENCVTPRIIIIIIIIIILFLLKKKSSCIRKLHCDAATGYDGKHLLSKS